MVLRHSNYGEADRILTLYTRDHGKLKVIAKGIRKIQSRKAGHLEPFTYSTIQLSRSHDLPIVTQAETITGFSNIHADLDRTAQAALVIELLDRFTFEAENNTILFGLVVETLKRLDETEDVFIPVKYYEIHLLDLLGYKPELFVCSICRKEIIAEDQYFSAQHGGVVCPSCGRTHADCRPVTVDALKFLRHFQRSNYVEASRAIPNPLTRGEMDDLLQYYFDYLLERGLNSSKFIREIHNQIN